MAITHESVDDRFRDHEWARDGEIMEVTDLADGGTLATVGVAGPEEARGSIEAAQLAQEAMRQSTLVERAEWLETIAAAIEAREEELAEVIVREAGKPISSARGEVASAAERFRRAVEEVHDEMVDLLDTEMDGWVAGDLFEEETTFGPLISEDQADWVGELVDDAIGKGATLVRGGERDGQFFEPTLLADVPHDARVLYEEQFGPIAAVTSFTDEEEALELANGGNLGLDASVFTSDYDRALEMAEQIRAGAVRINGAPSHGLGDIPFGGVKDSGIGREGLGYSIEEFVTTKSIVL